MVAKVESKTKVILDAKNANGLLGSNLKQSELSEVIEVLKEIKKQHSFEMEVFLPSPDDVLKLSKIHMEGLIGRLTVSGVTLYTVPFVSFHKNNSDYILHLDCDMLFYEKKDSHGLILQSI